MLFGIIDGEKTAATPGTTAVCPSCGRTMTSKCGNINVWHWAHHKDASCDTWYEPETEWHKNWKLLFGKDLTEVVISKDGVKHIADVFTKEKVVIELQNSPIEKATIREREIFYGEQMIWVINGKPFKNNFQYSRSRSFHLDDDDKYFWQSNPLAKKASSIRVSDYKGEYDFHWARAKKSWAGVQREVFIDFGFHFLFWVKEGMGTKKGKGKLITKEMFVKKHGGNLERLKRWDNR